MEKLSAEFISENIKLYLKNGEELVGYLPGDFVDNNDDIIFLSLENLKKVYLKYGDKYNFEYLKPFLQRISKKEILKYEILDSSIKGVETENNKPIPNGFEIQMQNPGIRGYIKIKYKIPNTETYFDLGLIKTYENGIIKLPITLIFLSYAKEDKEMVKFVMNELHNRGVLTWFDEKDLQPGDYWEDKILESIEKADYVFVFLSSKTINRDGYKNKELRYILKQSELKAFDKKYIIPILLDECKPPRELHHIHWLKVSEENWLDKLMKAVGK